MKSESRPEVKILFMTVLAVAAVFGFMMFGAFHPGYIKNDFAPGRHPVLGMLLTCFWLWLTSTVWLCAVNLLVLLVASPFFAWPSVRPAAIRAWIISILAFLCARFIVFYAGSL
jgi:hypothetical protein